jgi:8-hydroxy-5-deazaflavin:NADPH oxidoreductase
MRIGIVGGTGKEGSGLAMRWARAGHDVRIGSRGAERGASRGEELTQICGSPVGGGSNEWAIEGADVIVISVPYGAHTSTVQAIAPLVGQAIVVDITVPLAPPKVRRVHLPEGNAAALEAQALLPEGTKVVAGLHHVSSAHLADLEHGLPTDVLVCGTHRAARDVVIGLVGDLGARGLDAGVLANAVALEALTPVLIHLNKRYESAGGTGLRITGID